MLNWLANTAIDKKSIAVQQSPSLEDKKEKTRLESENKRLKDTIANLNKAYKDLCSDFSSQKNVYEKKITDQQNELYFLGTEFNILKKHLEDRNLYITSLKSQLIKERKIYQRNSQKKELSSKKTSISTSQTINRRLEISSPINHSIQSPILHSKD